MPDDSQEGQRITTTREGEPMRFIILKDEAGIFEVTLFPGACRRYSRVANGYGAYVVEGTVEDQYGALTVNACRLAPLDAALGTARRQASNRMPRPCS